VSISTCQLASITDSPFYCIKTNITPDQLMNHATWLRLSQLNIFTVHDYTDHLLFIGHLFMTPMPFEQNKRADPQ